MLSFLPTLCTFVLFAPEPIDTKFVQVTPIYRETVPWERTVRQKRAVVLLHGLMAHPFSSGKVVKAEWHSWQRPESTLVKALASESDVYAFAYSQNVAVDDIVGTRGLGDGIARLKELGYAEIVLVGHSAGGIVARQFVEDQPKAGVTKVVQVCTPNGGSSWGKVAFGVRHNQEAFVTSLTKECREECCAKRLDKKIPAQVEFVCLVGRLHVEMKAGVKPEDKVAIRAAAGLQGDGIVTAACQWTVDLQEQGIPMTAMEVAHFSAMRSQASADKIAQLVRERQPRWSPLEVAAARRKLLGEKERP